MILSTQATDLDQGRDRGARRADLVPALRHQQVRGRQASRQARRERRLRRWSRSRSTAAAAATRRRCSACAHDTRDCKRLPRQYAASTAAQHSKPIYEGVDLSGLRNIQSSAMTWDYVKRIRDATKMKVRAQGHPRLGGCQARRRGRLRRHHRVEPRRARRRGPAAPPSRRCRRSSRCRARMPVLIDSGFRRGTDIVKALCHGRQGRRRRPALPLGPRRLRRSPASSACSNSCASSCWRRCSRSARRRSSSSCRRW